MRRLYLDRSAGEARGVVTLNDLPERLLIERDGQAACQRLGARLVARVSRIERGLATAFLQMPDGPDAVAPLTLELVEGAALEIEIVAEARADKGAVVRILNASEGAPRLLEAGPSLAQRLAAYAPDAEIIEGSAARSVADEAQDAALSIDHTLPGGGSIAIETTRALTSIDVDVGARGGGDARRAARQTNLAAIGAAARLLRLKGIGGLIVFDLAGKGHDGAAMSAAAKTAFTPDGAGVSIGPISRFGLFEIALPRHQRPAVEILSDRPLTEAFKLLRLIEQEGRANPGSRLEATCSEFVWAAAQPHLSALVERLGPRFVVKARADQHDADYAVRTL